MFIRIPPLQGAAGTVYLPGSKSLSNRYLLLSALAEGKTVLEGVLEAEDTAVMHDTLDKLGVAVTRNCHGEKPIYEVTGIGSGMKGESAPGFAVKNASLFLGNAGTAMRSLTAVLSFCDGRYHLSGIERMHERPIEDLVSVLTQAGAMIQYESMTGYPPLVVSPFLTLLSDTISLAGDVSSQFLSGLLMALPLALNKSHFSCITVSLDTPLISRPYVEMTIKVMSEFGVQVKRLDWDAFTIEKGQFYRSPGVVQVEADASSASYFLAAASVGRGPILIKGLGQHSLQGDALFAERLAMMPGVKVERMQAETLISGPQRKNLSSSYSAHQVLPAFSIDALDIPDAAMTFAVLALFAKGTCRLSNIASWRVKETDRISAMATELRKLGASIEEGVDFLVIEPPSEIRQNVAINTYNDHRIAMCFSLVALAGVPIQINDPDCVAKTYPYFFEDFERLTAQVVVVDGPAASGKGTIASALAEKLGFHYLETGILYRATALLAMESHVADDELATAKIAAGLRLTKQGGQVFLQGSTTDVSPKLRQEDVGEMASKISAYPLVRRALLSAQRNAKRYPGLVAEGRDMATVVFPEAQVKLYLTASRLMRAKRRCEQLKNQGILARISSISRSLKDRDEKDSSRVSAPLKKVKSAKTISSTNLDVAQTVEKVFEFVKNRLG